MSICCGGFSLASYAGSDTLLLTITGEVVSQPCVLKPGDEKITVDMSTITDSDLARDKEGPTKPFQIHLEKCNASVAKGVKVTFSGTGATGDNTILALAPGSEAKGIGIGLREKDNTALPLNKASRPIKVANGNTTLEFGTYVKLLSLPDLKPGKFSATANFKLEYE
jgi:type 1 fimbria pilin